MNYAKEVIKDVNPDYIENWFGSDTFFNTEYVTGLLKGRFFITKETFLFRQIFAVREITQDGITTVSGGLDTIKQAKDFLKGIK